MSSLRSISGICVLILCFIGYKNQIGLNCFFKKYQRLYKIFPYFVCFIFSFLFANTFALSPFNNTSSGMDSNVFIYIGKAMYNGAIPYKDVFDHKGICLYFFEWFGITLGGGSVVGIWLIELINIFIISIILYKLGKLIFDDDYVCYMALYIALNISGLSFFGNEFGNVTEEYALLWITITLYFVTKYFLKKEYKVWNIILIGASFMIVFFLRPNMDGPIVAMVALVLINFILEKRYYEIFQCVLWFVIGCLVIVLPILSYLLYTDSLQDMIKYYFDFNIKYTASGSYKSVAIFIIFCAYFSLPSVICIFYSLVRNAKNMIFQVNLIALASAVVFSTIGGRGFLHYAIIYIPFFMIPTVMAVSDLIKKIDVINMKIKNGKKVIIFLLSIGVFLYPAYQFYVKISKPVEESDIVKCIKENTRKDDDVLILGNEVKYYLLSDRTTKNKFIFQTPVAHISDDIMEEFIEEMKSKPSDYIVYLHEEDNEFKTITKREVLDYLKQECDKNNYSVEKHDKYDVYKKNRSNK